MAEITLDEDKLVELIAQVVDIKLAGTLQDMDEIRRSPAGAIIRLEQDVKTIRKDLEIVHERIDSIIRTMATKTTQNYLIALVLAILGLIGTIFVKVLFFM